MTAHLTTRPAWYQLRVEAHVDQHWSPSLSNLLLNHESDGTTTLTGAVADQAELHGLLARIRDLGLTLISVSVVEPPGDVRRTERGARQHRQPCD